MLDRLMEVGTAMVSHLNTPPPPPSRVSSEAELTDKMLEGLEFGPPQELNEELLARLQLDPRLGSAFAEAIAEWTREPN